MGKGQVLFISVEGSDDAITEGLKAFQSGIALIERKRDNFAPLEVAPSPPATLPAAKAAEVADLAASISKRTVARAVSKVRRAADKQPTGGVVCRFCDKVCKTTVSRGKHESAMHPEEFAAAGPFKSGVTPGLSKHFVCGQKNCLKEFVSSEAREKHWAVAHS